MTPLKLTIGELTLELSPEGKLTVRAGPTIPTGGLDMLKPLVVALKPMLEELQRTLAAVDDDFPLTLP